MKEIMAKDGVKNHYKNKEELITITRAKSHCQNVHHNGR